MAKPIEGLTVRIWDPPSTSTGNEKKDKNNDKTSSVGSRGYRQYTEQVGSDKLKYSTHTDDWKKDTTAQADSTNHQSETGELRKSTRNWDTPSKQKVQDLPLVSRSTGSDQGLKSTELQQQLWAHILQKVQTLRHPQDKHAWEPIVILFRKLREGIYASHWSNNNISFSIQVFQRSVDTSLQAGDYNELIKSLVGLNDLYSINKQLENVYYTVLDILYHLCYISNPKVAMDRYSNMSNKQSQEAMWIKKLIKVICITKDPLTYFKLYKNNPYSAFRQLMKHYNDTIKIKAIGTLRKAYLSASFEWISEWLDVKPGDVVQELIRLDANCIKFVDDEKSIVFFSKK